jgi:phage-related protein
VIYFAAKGRKFVMLHGFMKKSRRTPTKDLKLAKKRMKEYLNG